MAIRDRHVFAQGQIETVVVRLRGLRDARHVCGSSCIFPGAAPRAAAGVLGR